VALRLLHVFRMQRSALASLLLAACASAGSSDQPLAEAEANQLATSIASTLRAPSGTGELAALLDAAALVRGDLPADLVREDDRTVRGQRAGFSFRYEVACRDDHNLPRPCARGSDNADIDASWSAVLATQASVMVATREGTFVANDIASERIRIDGDAHVEYASRIIATDEAHAFSYDASYQNIIVFPGEQWPRGGLVRYELDNIRAQARFAADGHVTITLADHAFDLDLATGIVVADRPVVLGAQ
jgi:hypothetical protein